jgi:hypothetical protein
MSDEIDAAQEEIARQQEAALRAARERAAKLRPTGRCYNCDAEVAAPEQLFCDVECAQDYERRQWASRMRA